MYYKRQKGTQSSKKEQGCSQKKEEALKEEAEQIKKEKAEQERLQKGKCLTRKEGEVKCYKLKEELSLIRGSVIRKRWKSKVLQEVRNVLSILIM